MPTGYTAHIEDGTITTGKDFLLLCSRAFGIAIDVKDEPLTVPTPTKFEPSDYYQKRYDKAKQELFEGRRITFEEAREHMRSAYRDKVEDAKAVISRMKSINDKYSKVRDQVVGWVPPTDGHESIKKFALEQIDMCMYCERDFQYWQKIIDAPLDDSDEAVQNYMKEFISILEEDLDQAKKNLDEAINNAKEKTEFMKIFIDSLDAMVGEQ